MNLDAARARVMRASYDELVMIAASARDPATQAAAVMRLNEIKKADEGAAKPKQPTVADGLIAGMPNSSAAPPPPQGEAIHQMILAQQMQPQMPQPPQGRAAGGPVDRGVSDLERAYMQLGPLYQAAPADPLVARSQAEALAPKDMMSGWRGRLDKDEEAAKADYKRNLWLNLAKAGFSAAGSPGSIWNALASLGTNFTTGMEGSIQERDKRLGALDGRRFQLDQTSQWSENKVAEAASNLYRDAENQKRSTEQARRAAASGVAGDVAADRRQATAFANSMTLQDRGQHYATVNAEMARANEAAELPIRIAQIQNFGKQQNMSPEEIAALIRAEISPQSTRSLNDPAVNAAIRAMLDPTKAGQLDAKEQNAAREYLKRRLGVPSTESGTAPTSSAPQLIDKETADLVTSELGNFYRTRAAKRMTLQDIIAEARAQAGADTALAADLEKGIRKVHQYTKDRYRPEPANKS